MASVLKVDKLDPQSGTALEIGTSGDTVTVPTGAGLTVTDEVKTNKISPATGAAFALGDSGDTFTVPSGATIVNSGTATGFGENNTPAFDVSGTDIQSVSTATYTKVTFDSESKDTDSAFDLTTERFTVPTDKGGLYTFQYSCQNSQKASANNYYQIVLYKNGSKENGTLVRQNPTTTGTYDVFLNGCASLELAATDYVEVFYYQNTGGSVNLEADRRKFSGFRVTE